MKEGNSASFGKEIWRGILRHKFAVKAQEYFVYFKISQWICGGKGPSKPADAIVRCYPRERPVQVETARVFVFTVCVFTDLSTQLTPSGGHIFLCLKKDMEERQTKGTAVPLDPRTSC